MAEGGLFGAGDHVVIAQRRARAVAMKRSGMNYTQIADAMEEYHGDRSFAYRDVQRALRDARAQLAESVEQLIQMEDERDDDIRRRIYAIIAARHYVVQGGKIVKDDDGIPLVDHGPVLQAIDRLDRLGARFARRHGLDQPERIEIAFEQRADLEVMAVVEAILAGFAAVDMPPEARQRALEAAQASLATIDGEVVSDTGESG